MTKINGSTDRVFENPFKTTSVMEARASVSNAAQYMLEDFGCGIGLPSLKFDENNECWIKLDNKHLLCIAAISEHETIRLHGHVETIQFDGEKKALTSYLRLFLEKNAEFAMNGEALFAIDPEHSALAIVKSVSYETTQQQMQDGIMNILGKMQKLHEDLFSERSSSSPSNELQTQSVKSNEIMIRA